MDWRTEGPIGPWDRGGDWGTEGPIGPWRGGGKDSTNGRPYNNPAWGKRMDKRATLEETINLRGEEWGKFQKEMSGFSRGDFLVLSYLKSWGTGQIRRNTCWRKLLNVIDIHDLSKPNP